MNFTNTLLVAAVGGVLAGAAGCAHKSAGEGSTMSGASESSMAMAKHDCKGMNSCKGQGGCKTEKNDCKGMNSCKGQGGCKTS